MSTDPKTEVFQSALVGWLADRYSHSEFKSEVVEESDALYEVFDGAIPDPGQGGARTTGSR